MKDKSLKEVQKKLVGKKIHDIRVNLGLTLEQFGELFDTNKSSVYRWEKGYNLPNMSRLKEIALKGGVDVTQLLQSTGQEAIKDIIETFKSLTREEKEECLTKLLNMGL